MKALLALLLLVPAAAAAQDDYALPRQEPKTDVRGWNIGPGIGIRTLKAAGYQVSIICPKGKGAMESFVEIDGIDQGGLGVQVQCRPVPRLLVFASGGYALAGFGWNFGVGGRLLPYAKWCPYLTAMYGYNAAIVIQGAADRNGIYYGPSIGIGVEDHRRRNYANFWRFGIVVPFRSAAYRAALDALRADPNFEVTGEPIPISISAAYHFGL